MKEWIRHWGFPLLASCLINGGLLFVLLPREAATHLESPPITVRLVSLSPLKGEKRGPFHSASSLTGPSHAISALKKGSSPVRSSSPPSPYPKEAPPARHSMASSNSASEGKGGIGGKKTKIEKASGNGGGQGGPVGQAGTQGLEGNGGDSGTQDRAGGVSSGSGSGTQAGGIGIVREEQIERRTKPLYPLVSRKRGEEGKVVLLVRVDPSGKVLEVKIETESGYPLLDRSAEKALYDWKFKPGSGPLLRVPVIFRLEEAQ